MKLILSALLALLGAGPVLADIDATQADQMQKKAPCCWMCGRRKNTPKSTQRMPD